jgi:hypothetical protein
MPSSRHRVHHGLWDSLCRQLPLGSACNCQLDGQYPLEGFARDCESCASRRTCRKRSWANWPSCITRTSGASSARPRLSGDTLKRLADALGVSSDYLLDGAVDEAAKAKFADRELLKQFQEVELLPDEDKVVVKKLLDAFLMKKHIQALTR